MTQTRVVNVRRSIEDRPQCEQPFLYVGRRFGSLLSAHPLANPFRVGPRATREQRLACLERYRAWLDDYPHHEEILRDLADEVQRTGKPLGCWCGRWPEQADLICHAVLLARRVDLILNEK